MKLLKHCSVNPSNSCFYFSFAVYLPPLSLWVSFIPLFSISAPPPFFFLSFPFPLCPGSGKSQASLCPSLTHCVGGWCQAGRRVSGTCSGPIRPLGSPGRPTSPRPVGAAWALMSSPAWPGDSFPQSPPEHPCCELRPRIPAPGRSGGLARDPFAPSLPHLPVFPSAYSEEHPKLYARALP